MTATPAWLGALEALLNRGLAASAQARGRAQSLAGASLLVDVSGVARVRACVVGERLALRRAGAEDTASASITGSPASLARLALGRSAASAAADAVRVSGDAEVAAAFRALLDAARPDVEEELARLVGDLPARQLARVARGAGEWLRGALRTAGQNLAEYLTEESRDVVNSVELQEYLRGVDAVREAADRVEARLARLERHLAERS